MFQERIQDFPEGSANPKGGANLLFSQNLAKTGPRKEAHIHNSMKPLFTTGWSGGGASDVHSLLSVQCFFIFMQPNNRLVAPSRVHVPIWEILNPQLFTVKMRSPKRQVTSSFSDYKAKVNYSSLCAFYFHLNFSESTNFCLFMLKYCTPKDAMLLNVLLVTHLLLCSNQMQGELRSVTCVPETGVTWLTGRYRSSLHSLR